MLRCFAIVLKENLLQDAHTLDFSSLATNANITTISLLNTTMRILHHASKDWSDGMEIRIKPEEVKVRYFQSLKYNHQTITSTSQAEQAILHDAAYFFMRRYYELRVVDKDVGFSPESLSCNRRNILQHGFRMYNYMLSVSFLTKTKLRSKLQFRISRLNRSRKDPDKP